MNRNPITTIRRSKFPKFVAAFIAVNIITQVCFPTLSFALTSGPGQEEFSSFEPASTSDMVDLYTGDFNYNIPLLSIPGPNGGYPINIAYHSGVTMEQEASWVGLGWSLNVGSINRQLRGLPDDYNGADGTNVIHTQKFGTSTTVSLDFTESLTVQIFGLPLVDLSLGAGIYYNNFRGLGERINVDLTYPGTDPNAGGCTNDGGAASIGLGITLDSQTGIGIEPDFSVKGQYKGYEGTAGISIAYNSRSGLQDLSFSTTAQKNKLEKGSFTGDSKGKLHQDYSKADLHGSSSLNFGINQVPSHQEMPMSNHGYSLTVNLAMASLWPFSTDVAPSITGGVSISRTSSAPNSPNSILNNNGYGYIYSPSATPGGTQTEMDFHRDEIKYSDKIPNIASSSLTYDVFNQTGQGTGCMFRPYLNSNGIVTNPQVVSTQDNTALEVQFGAGNLIHVKGGITLTSGTNSSGPWQASSDADDDLDPGLQAMYGFENGGCVDPIFENCYWQVYGEKSAVLVGNDDLSASWGGDPAVRVNLGVSNKDVWESITTADWYNAHFMAQNQFINSAISSSSPLTNTNNSLYLKNLNIVNGGSIMRNPRGNSIETFTNSQASLYGYSKNLTYDDQTSPSSSPNIASKNFSSVPGHAISEVSVLQSDGMRYTYGLPQYNNDQLDATFSVTGPDAHDDSKALIPTNNTIDIDASSTIQEYLNQTELTQKYASSWMLTSVVSDDYVDLTGNGPTPDDYGYWVKFNYKKTSSNYNWRVPYEESNYIEGMKNYPSDDKGVVSWGNKELYYIESVETKTHIAFFYTSPRQDGVGTSGNNLASGNQISFSNNNKMYKLDSIQLFTRAQFGTGAYPASAAIPIKTVRFQYDYSLCPGVPNNTTTAIDAWGNTTSLVGPNINAAKGKLTLKSLCFTYQGSTRGALSPYSFTYGLGGSDAIPYVDTWQDRWGTFKDNYTYNSYPYPAHDFAYTDVYNYALPYTAHSFQQMDNTYVGAHKAALWNLTGIGLPTGGLINVTYAQKDYAYVENLKAQAMFDIADVGGGGTEPINWDNTSGYDPYSDRATYLGAVNTCTNGARIWFKLKQPLSTVPGLPATSAAWNSYVYANYLESGKLDTVYYKVYCDLINKGGLAYYLANGGNGTADYVSGFATVDYGATFNYGSDASGQYGYLTLQTVPLSSTFNTPVNPITRACIEYLRADRPELLYPSYVANVNGTPLTLFWALVGGVISYIASLAQMVEGFNEYAIQLNYGENIFLNGRSVIRLAEPTGFKLGGGVKVTQLTLNDNWVNGISPQQYDYGQNYDYTTTDANGNIISSGVAYEPEIGNEESALCTPVNYPLSSPLSSSYHLFLENPIMRSYYPGASVGYGKVTVTSIGKSNAESDNSSNTLAVSAAPVSTYQFYTPKDFPVIPNQTDLSSDPPLTRFLIIPGLYSSVKKLKARSQGYSVALNDMAGKLKSVTVRTQPTTPNPLGTLVSEKDYCYQTMQPYDANGVNEVSDQVQVLSNDGSYATALLGQSNDIFTDMNEDMQASQGYGLNFDVDIGIPFLFYAFPIPYASYNELSLRTVVTNKAIYRTGIVDSVVTTTDNSRVVEKNLAYDPQTGEPLLTSVSNEFDKPIYNYSYPAYWYYQNMGGAYQNFGVTINPGICSLGFGPPLNPLFVAPILYGGDIDISLNIPAGHLASEYFTNGDQVWLDYGNSNSGQYTVTNVTSAVVSCIAPDGSYAPSGPINSIQVIKSGYKNLQQMKAGTLVTEAISGFTSYNPNNSAATTTAGSGYTPDYSHIIDAKAVQYSDQWGIECNANCVQCVTVPIPCSCTTSDIISVEHEGDTYTYSLTINGGPNLGSTFTGTWSAFVALIISQIETGSGYTITAVLNSDGTITLSASSEFCGATIVIEIDAFGAVIWNDTCTLSGGGVETICSGAASCNQIGSIINPYLTGLEGIWRPSTSWAYNTTRTQANPGDISKDGVYTTFSPFPWATQNPTATQLGNWVTANIITQYSPWGFELENKNAIGVYSAALYGYNNSLVTAVGSNARFNEIASDNFEDYPGSGAGCGDNDFRFIYSGFGNIVNTLAHTGLYSMQVFTSSAVSLSKNVLDTVGCAVGPCQAGTQGNGTGGGDTGNGTGTGTGQGNGTGGGNTGNGGGNSGSGATSNGTGTNPWIGVITPGIQSNLQGIPQFNFTECDCIGEFAPIPRKKYVISAWVNDIPIINPFAPNPYVNTQITYTDPIISIGFTDIYGAPIAGSSVTISPNGNIIEGWQRIYGTFTVPYNAHTITVSLVNSSTTKNVYFDDVRINPFNGNLNTYVYNNITLKVMAELDPNNYATFYNYDDEGHLTKIKKETTEGIETIKEGRINNSIP